MTDSVAVFPPGYRLTDNSTGAALSGAIVSFFDAGTTTPKTVYADDALSVALGTSVTTDALGYPTSDGTTRTLVYVGTPAYKVRIATSGGTTIAEHDNVKGAVETFDPGNVSVTFTRPVVTKGLNYSILSTDQSTIFLGNCSGGDVTFTLPSAVTVGAGWFVTIQHAGDISRPAGTSHQIIINTAASQTISSGFTSYGTAMALSLSGEEITLVSDSGNWRAINHLGPHIKRAQGILTVTDRLTAPPGSEVQGALYLISGAPTGAWASFAEGDIVQFSTTGVWVRFTPPADSGWLAFVQDEDTIYKYVGTAWVALTATQSDMETATNTTRYVTPGRVQNHPGVAKFWAKVTVSGSTPTLAASYNITSVSRSTTGIYTLTIGTDFSSANWCAIGTTEKASSGSNFLVSVSNASQAAGTITVNIETVSGSNTDPPAFHVVGFGDQ